MFMNIVLWLGKQEMFETVAVFLCLYITNTCIL